MTKFLLVSSVQPYFMMRKPQKNVKKKYGHTTIYMRNVCCKPDGFVRWGVGGGEQNNRVS